MKLTKKKKKFIRDNYEVLQTGELAKQTNISEKEIKKYLHKELKVKSSKLRRKVVNSEMANERINSLLELWEFIKSSKGILAIIAILCFAVYANSLGGDFVSDDIEGYVQNTYVHNLGNAVQSAFGLNNSNKYNGPGIVEIVAGRYNYILTTFGFFYGFFGENEIPLHLLSVYSHIMATCLLYIFISMMFDKRIGIIAALLFAVHPINTEAIAWISGRKYLVMAQIIFSTGILYGIYKNNRSLKYLGYTTLYFSIALLTTQFMWLIVLPPALLIIDQCFIEKKINFKSALAIIPITLPAAVFGVFYIYEKYLERVVNLETKYNFDRSATAPIPTRTVYTIFKSVEFYIWPQNLALYHEGEAISSIYFVFMSLVAIAFIGAIIYFWKKDIRISGLLLFTLIALAPTFSPVQVAWLIAERYLYIPGFAFCTLLAISMVKLEKRTGVNNLTVILLVTIMTIYSIRTVVRNKDWATRQNVWESTQRISPRSPRVYNNLGDVYGKAGDDQRSIASYIQAIRLDPDYAEATHNLGNAYARIRELELARQAYERAYQLKPTQYQSIHMIGVLELEQGNYDKAKELFEQVLEVDPNYSPSIQGLTIANEAISTGQELPPLDLRSQ